MSALSDWLVGAPKKVEYDALKDAHDVRQGAVHFLEVIKEDLAHSTNLFQQVVTEAEAEVEKLQQQIDLLYRRAQEAHIHIGKNVHTIGQVDAVLAPPAGVPTDPPAPVITHVEVPDA